MISAESFLPGAIPYLIHTGRFLRRSFNDYASKTQELFFFSIFGVFFPLPIGKFHKTKRMPAQSLYQRRVRGHLTLQSDNHRSFSFDNPKYYFIISRPDLD